ncbi:MAG TPA: glycoside hydrolase family 3 N-terminal domain-containing protein, partial [Alphaproteobacteria bacterium]|nr:glycoside hydrolase family 3 N-terminal domain-containing protein [Alphaproteobacteria bacterium]
MSNPDSAGAEAPAGPRLARAKGARPLPVVFGCAGTALTSAERKLFSACNPFGFILFTRNCENPEQVRWLIKELRQTVERADAPVLIDQEGGRVARLKPPHWPKHPPARVFGAMYETDPAWGVEAIGIQARLVANELGKLGITVNCAPVVDLFIDGASNAIGDRAFSSRPAIVAELARHWAEMSLAHGVLPVIKHMPGHGRLNVDPHVLAPVIDAPLADLEAEDFVPFELLKDLPIAMNSHAVFTAIDPDEPASMSATVQGEVIREMIGFDGLLLSDDINMKALRGAAEELAKKAIHAGNDVVLHCD